MVISVLLDSTSTIIIDVRRYVYPMRRVLRIRFTPLHAETNLYLLALVSADIYHVGENNNLALRTINESDMYAKAP